MVEYVIEMPKCGSEERMDTLPTHRMVCRLKQKEEPCSCAFRNIMAWETTI